MLWKTPKKPDSKGLNKISHIVALLLPHRVEYTSPVYLKFLEKGGGEMYRCTHTFLCKSNSNKLPAKLFVNKPRLREEFKKNS